MTRRRPSRLDSRQVLQQHPSLCGVLICANTNYYNRICVKGKIWGHQVWSDAAVSVCISMDTDSSILRSHNEEAARSRANIVPSSREPAGSTASCCTVPNALFCICKLHLHNCPSPRCGFLEGYLLSLSLPLFFAFIYRVYITSINTIGNTCPSRSFACRSGRRKLARCEKIYFFFL